MAVQASADRVREIPAALHQFECGLDPEVRERSNARADDGTDGDEGGNGGDDEKEQGEHSGTADKKGGPTPCRPAQRIATASDVCYRVNVVAAAS